MGVVTAVSSESDRFPRSTSKGHTRLSQFVPYPVRIPNLQNVVAISAGDRHSLALLKDGTVRAWGLNRHGQVGDGTSTNRDVPTTVPGVRNAVAIAAGGYRSVAVLADGTVMEWGANHVNLTPRLGPTHGCEKSSPHG